MVDKENSMIANAKRNTNASNHLGRTHIQRVGTIQLIYRCRRVIAAAIIINNSSNDINSTNTIDTSDTTGN
jgi:hypothetical protein